MTADEAQEIIDFCSPHESALSAWERDFLDDIEDKLADGYEPTERQSTKLDEIYDKILGAL